MEKKRLQADVLVCSVLVAGAEKRLLHEAGNNRHAALHHPVETTVLQCSLHSRPTPADNHLFCEV